METIVSVAPKMHQQCPQGESANVAPGESTKLSRLQVLSGKASQPDILLACDLSTWPENRGPLHPPKSEEVGAGEVWGSPFLPLPGS